ncbi:MAG: DNA ligase [Campylobacterota bacterium]|nr:DNA ligase [Campylobacterota bacterium]
MLKLLLIYTLLLNLYAQKPELVLLKNYTKDVNVTSWFVSEKLDGIRAYWNGKRLISRSGKTLNAPKFFTEDFPPFELDGELWSKREDFSTIVSIVNKKSPHDGWKNLTYNIFEVPSLEGNLTTRLHVIEKYIENHQNSFIRVIPQHQIKSTKELDEFLVQVQKSGAEGVVVRDGSLPYYVGRKKSALKVKSYVDDECEVVGYNRGRGKYEGMVGSISCRMKNLQIINIGSGLSDNLRAIPPKIGSFITFKYYGLTSKGNPRFPVFVRIKESI